MNCKIEQRLYHHIHILEKKIVNKAKDEIIKSDKIKKTQFMLAFFEVNIDNVPKIIVASSGQFCLFEGEINFKFPNHEVHNTLNDETFHQNYNGSLKDQNRVFPSLKSKNVEIIKEGNIHCAAQKAIYYCHQTFGLTPEILECQTKLIEIWVNLDGKKVQSEHYGHGDIAESCDSCLKIIKKFKQSEDNGIYNGNLNRSK
jgi:hypothetical protein